VKLLCGKNPTVFSFSQYLQLPDSYIYYLPDRSFSIVTRQRAGRQDFNSRQKVKVKVKVKLSLCKGTKFFSSQPHEDEIWGSHTLTYRWCQRQASQWWSGWSVKLNTHLHLASRLKMLGVVPQLSFTFSWRGAQLHRGYVCTMWRFLKQTEALHSNHISQSCSSRVGSETITFINKTAILPSPPHWCNWNFLCNSARPD
jgi:hypothetical protein